MKMLNSLLASPQIRRWNTTLRTLAEHRLTNRDVTSLKWGAYLIAGAPIIAVALHLLAWAIIKYAVAYHGMATATAEALLQDVGYFAVALAVLILAPLGGYLLGMGLLRHTRGLYDHVQASTKPLSRI